MAAEPASLLPGPDPSYRFLPGGEPYSSGAVATSGWEVVHVTLQAPVPWRDGFAAIERHLRGLGRPRTSLCAVELRVPRSLTFTGFAEFNRELPGAPRGVGTARRRPEPRRSDQRGAGRGAAVGALALRVLPHRSGRGPGRPTFVAAGSGELRPGPASRASVVRPDETSPDALREKAAT